MLNIDLVLYVVAIVLMALAGFNVSVPRVNWMCLSFMAMIITLIV